MIEAFTVAGTFLFLAGVSFLGLVAIYFLVPETKGLQFEEVEKMLKKASSHQHLEKNHKKKKIEFAIL